MPTSDAANTYAEARCCNLTQSVRRGENCKSSGTRESLAAAFDAGCAHALATVTPRTTPERVLTRSEATAYAAAHPRCIFRDRDGDYSYTGNGSYEPYTLVYDPSWQPATAAPEPVMLTDPEDPRIKPGARVRVVLEATVSADPWGELRSDWVSSHIKGTYKVTEGVYLLAEAPDPDADAREALTYAAEGVRLGDEDMLGRLRHHGYDVVKVER